jgi:hypothetical protein
MVRSFGLYPAIEINLHLKDVSPGQPQDDSTLGAPSTATPWGHQPAPPDATRPTAESFFAALKNEMYHRVFDHAHVMAFRKNESRKSSRSPER